MAIIKDLTGQVFGRLSVVCFDGKTSNGNAKWLCKCICGNKKTIASWSLKSGKTQSCGCFNKERTKETSTTHGKSKTPLYRLWTGVKNRCYNKNEPKYCDYGERGILVCSDWENNFKSFEQWALTSGYKKGLSIDRMDVNGNYEPSNCRWATQKVQQNNRRNNRLLTCFGRTQTTAQWADEIGVRPALIEHRINRGGWSDYDAITTPVGGVRG